MTRVGGIGGGTVTARRPVRAAGGFALAASGGKPGAAPAQAASGVSALLALQEQGGPAPEAPSARAQRRGAAALEELRGLQLDLLRGRADSARLERLAALADGRADGADPILREVVEAIALRAKVELARRRVATAST